MLSKRRAWLLAVAMYAGGTAAADVGFRVARDLQE
jgi:hypothetical protein